MDSGVTHNFINPMMAKRIRLPLQHTSTFEVVDEGGELAGKFCCTTTTLQIQGFESSTDLLVVSLGDAQVILDSVT